LFKYSINLKRKRPFPSTSTLKAAQNRKTSKKNLK
jgi:hypothetical protein